MKIMNQVIRFGTCVAMLAVMAFAPMTATAGMFSWGDIAGTDVMFLNVSESNAETTTLFAPMPGTGGPIVAGNSLHLDPQNFSSQSQNNSADLIDSTLSTVIMAGPGSVLNSVSISELGDYSLGGLVGGQASAEVGAAFFWTVLEVDNMAVSMATQATNLILGTGAGPNGGQYDRPADDGTAVIWNGVANIDLAGFLASQQVSGAVTKLRLVFDNTLQTSADDVSSAFIKKKSVDIIVDADPMVPEPSTALLLGLGLALAPGLRRRR